jgi:hypothetical protein
MCISVGDCGSEAAMTKPKIINNALVIQVARVFFAFSGTIFSIIASKLIHD